MAIKFHCNHCGKHVSAPDSAGGKRGKCPYCQQRCYIPLPADQVDEIPLSATDPDENRRSRKLQQESAGVFSDLSEDTGPADDRVEPPPRPESPQADESPAPREFNLRKAVEEYLLCMVRGDLNSAEPLAAKIAQRGDEALDVIDELATNELLHSDLAQVPQRVIAGFFRQLRRSISR